MRSRRLRFWAEIVALLLAFGCCATANTSACVFEQIETANLHRCFPPSTTIPLLAINIKSGVMGTLSGAFMNGADDLLQSGLKSRVLTLHPAPLNPIPMRRTAEDSTGEVLYILFKLVFMPTGPHKANLSVHRRR